MSDIDTRPKRVFSFTRAAADLDISERTLRRMVDAGLVRAVRLSLRRRGIPSEEVTRLATEGVAT